MSRFSFARLLPLAALLGVAGCEQYDPLYRAGTWNPMHVNSADLTMQAAYPADLVRGTGAAAGDGQLAAAAVTRLHTDKVKKLPEAGVSDITTQGQGGSGS
jgi:hypothetical protein